MYIFNVWNANYLYILTKFSHAYCLKLLQGMWPKLNFASGKRKIQFGFPYRSFTKDPLPSLPFCLIFAFVILAKTTPSSRGLLLALRSD